MPRSQPYRRLQLPACAPASNHHQSSRRLPCGTERTPCRSPTPTWTSSRRSRWVHGQGWHARHTTQAGRGVCLSTGCSVVLLMPHHQCQWHWTNLAADLQHMLATPPQEEIAEMKRAEAAREKLVGDVVRENRRLAEPLSQVGAVLCSFWQMETCGIAEQGKQCSSCRVSPSRAC